MSSIDIDEPYAVAQKALLPEKTSGPGQILLPHLFFVLKCAWLVLSTCNLCYFMWQASIDLPSTCIIWEYTLFHYILSGPWPNRSSWSLLQLPLLFPVQCRASQSCIISVDFPAPNCCPLTNSSQARACSCLLGFLSWQELSWCCLHTRTLVPALQVALCVSVPNSSAGAVDFPQTASLSHPVTLCSFLSAPLTADGHQKSADFQHFPSYLHNHFAECQVIFTPQRWWRPCSSTPRNKQRTAWLRPV